MKNKLSLTREQQDEICYLIGEWYLEWKNKILSDTPGQHRLGAAKEQLKDMICEIEKEACKWTHENGDFWHETSCGKECSNGEFCEVTENFVYCPYCGNKIDKV